MNAATFSSAPPSRPSCRSRQPAKPTRPPKDACAGVEECYASNPDPFKPSCARWPAYCNKDTSDPCNPYSHEYDPSRCGRGYDPEADMVNQWFAETTDVGVEDDGQVLPEFEWP